VEFARIRQRSFRFGLLTFGLPMAGGLLLGLGFGSILSSHTPLGYPIVRSYGAVREESVVVAIGGTIFTDIAALVVLALTVGLARGAMGPLGAIGLLLKVAAYAALVLVLIQRLGRLLVRRQVNNDSQLFVLVLLAVFLAALAAELAGVEKIVGAFLAGLAVNGVLPEGRVKEQVIFVGASLFIPIFFIDLGLLLNLPAFLATLQGSLFAVGLIATLIASKGLASWWAGRIYRYNSAQMLTLWSLSLPQVAATLAATCVGFRAGLLDEQVLNSVLALMVVTATLGPSLTALAMPRLGRAMGGAEEPSGSGSLALVRRPLTVLLPVANPDNERPLLSLARLLIGGDADHPGRVLPLAVVAPNQPEAGGASAAALTAQLGQGRQLLEQAKRISAEQAIPCQTLLRVDTDVAAGIARTAMEQGTDLVLMGLAPPSRLGRWLFGDLVEATCRQVPCPVVVARLVSEPSQWQRLLVPVKDLTAGALEQFQLAERLAVALGASLTLLHLHDPRLGALALAERRRDLERWSAAPAGGGNRDGPGTRVEVRVELQPNHGVETTILRRGVEHDLVILRSQRRLVAGLPIPASDLTTRLLQRLSSTTLVISDPLH
jgi:Kef-type K+ transport system membrane component KefB/nucleotide-binding universal stress UspA family protein